MSCLGGCASFLLVHGNAKPNWILTSQTREAGGRYVQIDLWHGVGGGMHACMKL